MIIGLIADTHSLVRAQIFDVFRDVELILHAGDVGGRSVLERLRAIAPVHAVYGNTDPVGEPDLEAQLELQAAGVTIHVSHGHELGSPTPDRLLTTYAADVIVYGHTHKALIERRGTRLVINPGAAGPRRFNLAPSVARLTLGDGGANARIIPLD